MAAIDRRTAVTSRSKGYAALAAGLALLCAGPGLLSASPSNAQSVGLTPIEQLHKALNLAPSQEGAWQLYRSASDVPDKAQSRRRSASVLFRTLDAPHRMDLVEAEMRQELADLQRQSQALKAFYAALSPGQQKVFDARTLPPANEGQGQQ